MLRRDGPDVNLLWSVELLLSVLGRPELFCGVAAGELILWSAGDATSKSVAHHIETLLIKKDTITSGKKDEDA